MVYPSGERWVSTWLVPVTDEAGTVTSLFGLERDLTERKEAEKALRAVEIQYRRILETAHEGILTTNAAGQLTSINEQFAAMLGHKVDEMLGRKLARFMFRKDLSTSCGGIEGDGPESDFYECRFRRKDGSELWTLVSAIPVTARNTATSPARS